MKRVHDQTIRTKQMDKFERKKHLKSIGKTFFLIFLLLVIAAGLRFGRWVSGVLAETRDLDVDLIVSVNRTQILDKYGSIIHETGTTREWVHLHEISPVMIDAILAIEDARFFEHEGVDWTRTLGAQMVNVQTFIHGTGGLQGGSTLTQQLINQTHLLTETGQRDTTIERKLQEMSLSFEIERILSKDQIMEAYLNYSPFGGGIYGIQAASEFYFGVNANELTLSQAATLAGLVQAPNEWRPDWNTHLTEQRRNEVLEMMYRHGYINEILRDLAASEPISDMLVYYTSVTAEENAVYLDYINHVLNEAENRWGINPHAGYIIETYLDPDIQTLLVNSVTTNDYVWWPDDHIQGAVSIIETQTGIIRGLAGRDLQQTDDGERRRVMATDITRSIGSTSKPIWSYGPAMEYLYWSPGTMLEDDMFWYEDGGMLVRNWSMQHEGRVTMRQAMAPSWNPPAIQAFNAVMEVDPDLVENFVLGMGFPEVPPNMRPEGFPDMRVELYEASPIGAHTFGFAPIHLAGAYAAFGNTGIYNEPRAIHRIIAPDGTIYYQPDQIPLEEGDEIIEPFRQERMMREETAYMMTDMLRTTVTNDQSRGSLYWSTGMNADIPGWYVAVKTGTTNYSDEVRQEFSIPIGGVPDVWIAGYTYEFTMAVWVGYNTHADGYLYGNATRELPSHLFREVMSRIEHENPTQRHPRPENVVEMGMELMGGTEIGETCSPSTATPPSLIVQELFYEGHGPSCVSTGYSMTEADAPSNFRVGANGLSFAFDWDHVTTNSSMSLSEAQAAVYRAREMKRNVTYITDELRNLNPTEGQASTIVRRIQAAGEMGTGQMEYVVIATLLNGGTRELGRSTSNYLDRNLSLNDLANIYSFHVITRLANGQTSGPSNVVLNNNMVDLDPSEFLITIPNMEGWTLNQFHQWRNMNDIENFDITDAYHNTVPEGRIITTNPTGSMDIMQLIRVTLSLGSPLNGEDNEPGFIHPPTDDEYEDDEENENVLPAGESTPEEEDLEEHQQESQRQEIHDDENDNDFDPFEGDPLNNIIPLSSSRQQPIAILPRRRTFKGTLHSYLL